VLIGSRPASLSGPGYAEPIQLEAEFDTAAMERYLGVGISPTGEFYIRTSAQRLLRFQPDHQFDRIKPIP
jgi:hypothetical protein